MSEAGAVKAGYQPAKTGAVEKQQDLQLCGQPERRQI